MNARNYRKPRAITPPSHPALAPTFSATESARRHHHRPSYRPKPHRPPAPYFVRSDETDVETVASLQSTFLMTRENFSLPT